MSSTDAVTTETPAKLPRRLTAHAIDAVILLVALLAVWSVGKNFVTLTLVPYVNTAIVLGYAVALESSHGQTVGKQLLRLRVTNQHGVSPTVGQAFRRNLYFVLALLPGFIGGLVTLTVIGWIAAAILVDIDHRQGIHDRFARETFVTRYGAT